MAESHITVSRNGALMHILLNRPAKRNAMSAAMYAAMAVALLQAEDDGTAVVIISGAGSAFSAGNDLADFVANRPDAQEAPVFRFLRALFGSSRILVAAVHGPAIGIGTTMLLHCDFVVAAEDAVLQMPFVDLAIVPEAASSLLVPRLVGHQRAADLLLLAEKIGAARARELGLVNRVVPVGMALAEAEKLAAELLAKPRSALLATKRLMASPTQDIPGRMREEGRVFAAQLKTPELAATVEKFFAARAKA
jgi:enoyl-CoA hydratase/carnithine racemase